MASGGMDQIGSDWIISEIGSERIKNYQVAQKII